MEKRTIAAWTAGFLAWTALTVGMSFYAGKTIHKPEKEIVEIMVPSTNEVPATTTVPAEEHEDIADLMKQENRKIKHYTIEEMIDGLRKQPQKVLDDTTDKWIVRYASLKGCDVCMFTDLEEAIGRSERMIGDLKQLFKNFQVPEDYAFLAIPESHFINDEKSPAGALGAYQLMPGTAANLGLIVTPSYDERENPYICAWGAAKLLKELRGVLGKDWSLVLAAFNSGKPRNKFLPKRWDFGDGNINYRNYLLYQAKNLEKIKMRVDGALQKDRVYRVKKGDIPSVLIKKATGRKNLSKDILEGVRRYNNLKSINSIRIGQLFKVPAKYNAKRSDRSRRALINQLSNFTNENLNYPPKMDATCYLLKKYYPDYFNIPAESTIQISEIRPNIKTIHTVKRGQYLTPIAKMYGTSVASIKKANNLKDDKIKAGKKLKIPYNGINLRTLSKKKKVDLDILVKLNNHIDSAETSIPYGAKIVFPR